MYKEHPANARTSGDKELPSDLTSSFHYVIWPFLLIAQFMGVLPVSGIREKDVTRVQFKWVFVGVLVTMVLIASVAIDLLLSLNIVFERGMKTYTAGPVMFSLISLLGLITFLLLARQWPDLIKQFTDTEKIFLEKSYETKESKEICFRLRLYGGVLLFGATVQHGLYINTAIYDNKYQINKCNLTTDFWENLFIRERLQYFSIINFHIWMVPLFEWLTISMSFTWNFIDIFLMLVTSSLALRFGQVSKSIRRFTSVPMTDEFWLRARKDFICLMDLLQAVDNRLSNLVVLSCAHNLYFICFHVFQSFQQRSNFFEAIYFWYSLSFGLTRILTSMLSAASITDTANESLTAFYDIPLDFWGIELTRFYESVASDLIAISGKGFYFITRRLIFAMAGTVVTYELVLVDQVKDVVDRGDFCISRKV